MACGGFYLYIHGKLEGPCSAAQLLADFGGISPETLVCTELDFLGGRPQWRKITLFPELASCVKDEIARPLPEPRPVTEPKRRLTILSTDDDANIRALLWGILEEAGHEVEFARDGEDVFRRLAAKRYDLLILDVNMPGMNGYKVSEVLHERLQSPPKVIIFTGRNIEDEKVQYACSGADAILNKGSGNNKLLAVIDSLFGCAARPRSVPEAQPLAAAAAAQEIQKVPLAVEIQAQPAAAPAAGNNVSLSREEERLRSEFSYLSDRLARLELAYAQLERKVLQQGACARQAKTSAAPWPLMLSWPKFLCVAAGLLFGVLIAFVFLV